jgi:hypothetical protein
VAEEYCGVMTQAVGLSCCSRSRSGVVVYSLFFIFGIRSLYPNILEHSVCSVFIGCRYEDGTDAVFRNIGI